MSHPENQGPTSDNFSFSENSALRRHTELSTGALYVWMAAMTAIRDEVGAAVDHHSNFREDPFGRLGHTMLAAGQLVFGNSEETAATAQKIYEFHKTVKGNHRGIEYNANSIDMQVWVLGCVYMGINESKNRWVKPLEPDERQAIYSDIRKFGLFFGIPGDSMTKDVGEFEEYLDYTIENDSLNQQVSREITTTVLLADTDRIPKWMQRINRAICLTSLDPRLQERLELHPTDQDKQIASRIDKTIRGFNRVVPTRARRGLTPLVLKTKRAFSGRPKSHTTSSPH